MNKGKLKKIGNVILHIFLYLFLALCLFSVVLTVVAKKDVDGAAELFGYQMRVVTSDSMAACELTDVSGYEIKSIPLRSMIFVELVPEDKAAADAWYASLKEGDVLTFRYVYTQQVTITHRITSITEKETGGYLIELAGDNKNAESGQLYQTIDTSLPNSTNYVIGKVTGQAFLLGFLISLMKTPIGIIFIVIVPCFIIILLEVLKIVGVVTADKKKREQEEAEKKERELEELRQRLAQLEQREYQPTAAPVTEEASLEIPAAPEPTEASASEASAAQEEKPAPQVPQTKETAAEGRQATLAAWKAKIEERAASGLSVEQWCQQEGISKNTYYYRLKKVKELDTQQTTKKE